MATWSPSEPGPRRSKRSTPSKYATRDPDPATTVEQEPSSVLDEAADVDPSDVDTVKVLCLGLVLIAVGTAGFLALEPQNYAVAVGSSKVGEMSVVDALYISTVTLTTVGYGDVVPTTFESKAFTVALSMAGLGFFGTLIDTTAGWHKYVPGGLPGVLAATVGAGAVAFHLVEGWPLAEAAYFSVITSTSIGYGDHAPFKSDTAKLLLVSYAMLSVGAMAAVINGLGEITSNISIPGGIFTLCVTFVSAGAAGLFLLEPNITDPIDAVYLAVITLTTIGYGDLYPTTPESKVFVVIFALLGLGLTSNFLDAVAKWKNSLPLPSGFAGVVILSIITFGSGTAIFCIHEGWALSEALYFSVITSTSIGYGDHNSETGSIGKIVVITYSIVSMGVTAVIVTSIGEVFTSLCKESPSKTRNL